MTPDGTAHRDVVRFRAGVPEETSDAVVAEAPLEIRLRGVPLAVLMRTPGNEEDLVAGFALTEGIVLHPGEISAVRRLPGDPEDNRWELVLAEGVQGDPSQFARNFYTTSSCGVCGKASIDAVRVAAPAPPPGPQLTATQLLALPERMRAGQAAFDETGGLHAAAVFDANDDLLVLREDVGRHNAVDKAVGALARSGVHGGELVLLVSGRVSFEIVQKAAVARIPVVCGVSAASSLAVDLAGELGLTVVGFLRSGGFNIYTGAQRLRV